MATGKRDPLRRLANDPTVRELAALWRRLEDGPNGPQHGTANLGNLRLTALSGLLVLILLAAVYATGTFFGDLRGAHFFVGFALIPPLVLKVASTAWRFAHYYLGTDRYRAEGPPWLLPRLLAPPLVLATIVAFVSGVILWAAGTQRGTWSTVHTDSIVVLLGLVGLHLGIHLRRAVRAVRGDQSSRSFHWRWGGSLLAVALGLGLAIGLAGIEPPWHARNRHLGALPGAGLRSSTRSDVYVVAFSEKRAAVAGCVAAH